MKKLVASLFLFFSFASILKAENRCEWVVTGIRYDGGNIMYCSHSSPHVGCYFLCGVNGDGKKVPCENVFPLILFAFSTGKPIIEIRPNHISCESGTSYSFPIEIKSN